MVTAVSISDPADAPGRVHPLVVAVLTLWFVTVFATGAAGAFVTPLGQPPFRIALGFGLPLLTFFSLLGASRAFRDFVSRLDLPFITALQAWRVGGFVFIVLYVYRVLPGVFAWPAGLGDIAIGIMAPWMALTLARRKDFLRSRVLILWNWLGIADLVLAVTIGTAVSLLAGDAVITTKPLAQLPLVLIPAFLVPLFIMLHVGALIQASQARQ